MPGSAKNIIDLGVVCCLQAFFGGVGVWWLQHGSYTPNRRNVSLGLQSCFSLHFLTKKLNMTLWHFHLTPKAQLAIRPTKSHQLGFNEAPPDRLRAHGAAGSAACPSRPGLGTGPLKAVNKGPNAKLLWQKNTCVNFVFAKLYISLIKKKHLFAKLLAKPKFELEYWQNQTIGRLCKYIDTAVGHVSYWVPMLRKLVFHL